MSELEIPRITAPKRIRVALPCPDCGELASIDAQLTARRVKDSDGTTTLALRARAPKVAHECDQLTLEAIEP